MEWKKVSDSEYNAIDNDCTPSDRYHSIDQFLFGVLKRIGEAYDYKNCAAIIFDIRGPNLQVFDSPHGCALNNDWKVNASLHNSPFNLFYENELDQVAKKYGDHSYEFEDVILDLDKITSSAISTSTKNGKGRIQIDKFNSEPKLILLRDGDERLAHSLLDGARVAMGEHEIEEHSVRHCQCDYCERNPIDNSTKHFEVFFLADEPKHTSLSYSYQTIEKWFNDIKNGELPERKSNTEFEQLVKVINDRYPTSAVGKKDCPWEQCFTGPGYLLLIARQEYSVEIENFLSSTTEPNYVISFYPSGNFFGHPDWSG